MRKTLQDNRLFFYLMLAFVVIGGILLASTSKVDGLVFFSSNRSPFLDEFFIQATKLGEAPVYFVIGILALVVRIRYAMLVGLTGLSVLTLSFGLKSLFAIDRPFTYLTQQNLLENVKLIDGVVLNTGATSFPSGHSMSAFALYSLLIFILPSEKKYVFLFFLLALAVGFSRMYLVQHFWPDVYVGGIIGAGLAMLIYTFQAKIIKTNATWVDRPIHQLTKKLG